MYSPNQNHKLIAVGGLSLCLTYLAILILRPLFDVPIYGIINVTLLLIAVAFSDYILNRLKYLELSNISKEQHRLLKLESLAVDFFLCALPAAVLGIIARFIIEYNFPQLNSPNKGGLITMLAGYFISIITAVAGLFFLSVAITGHYRLQRLIARIPGSKNQGERLLRSLVLTIIICACYDLTSSESLLNFLIAGPNDKIAPAYKLILPIAALLFNYICALIAKSLRKKIAKESTKKS